MNTKASILVLLFEVAAEEILAQKFVSLVIGVKNMYVNVLAKHSI